MGYFEAIGVDSELVMQSGAESTARNRADTAEWHLMNGSYQGDNPIWQLSVMSQNIDGWSFNKAKDPRIDALYRAVRESIDVEEVKSVLRQADEIAVREHWGLNKSASPVFSVNQPWVKGYNGEWNMGRGERNTFMARIWIDSELKKAMGH